MAAAKALSPQAFFAGASLKRRWRRYCCAGRMRRRGRLQTISSDTRTFRLIGSCRLRSTARLGHQRRGAGGGPRSAAANPSFQYKVHQQTERNR